MTQVFHKPLTAGLLALHESRLTLSQTSNTQNSRPISVNPFIHERFMPVQVCRFLLIIANNVGPQVIGAPSYFPTIWGWIKKWVDPGTISKIFILSPEEVLPTLQQYAELADIPQRFGGEFEFYHGMQPVLDPVIADLLSWQPSQSTLPKGPMKWVDEGWGRRAAVATGSSDGSGRNEKIAVLRPHKRSQK